MDVRLKELKLENFKGQTFTLVPDGKNLNVLGANASGKTSLLDGYLWVVSGKDSKTNTNFDIKTLDTNGETQSNLVSTVSLTLTITDNTESREVVLSRSYAEKWTRKRGEAKASFTGHVTDYAVNGVPVKKTEFESEINTYFPIDDFRLLSNVKHFCELPWKTMRDILTENFVSPPSTADLFEAEPQLEGLRNIFDEYKSIGDAQKVFCQRKKAINKQLVEVPARIDELSKSVMDAEETVLANAEVQSLEARLKDTPESEEERQKKAVEAMRLQLQTLSQQATFQKNSALAKIQAFMDSTRRSLSETEGTLRTISNVNHQDEVDEKLLAERMATLRADWQKVSDSKVIFSENCPTCGQPLPIEERQKTIYTWENNKTAKLNAISDEGKKLSDKRTNIQSQIELRQPSIKKVKKEFNDAQLRLSELEKDLEQINVSDYRGPDFFELEKQIEGAKRPIPQTEDRSDNQKATLKTIIGTLAASKQALVRIAELSKEETSLAKEFEYCDKILFLIELYHRTRAEYLESQLNSQFQAVKFKLFESQINGGTSPTCVPLLNGVPYPSVNSAGQIQMGVEILNALQKKKNLFLPVWIDNAETVQNIPDTQSQAIALTVADVKQLTVKEV